jgi:hypothetical protein
MIPIPVILSSDESRRTSLDRVAATVTVTPASPSQPGSQAGGRGGPARGPRSPTASRPQELRHRHSAVPVRHAGFKASSCPMVAPAS